MSPAVKHVKEFVRWDGGLAAVIYPAGMYFLSVNKFFIARALFTVSTILLAARVFSASEQFESKRGKVIFCLGALLATFALWVISWYWVLYEESAHPKPALSTWIASYFTWVWGIPFRSVFVGLGIIGLICLVVVGLDRLIRERCPDKRLHLLAERDKASIREYVWVTSIYYQPAFDKSEPYIDFIFCVFNNSLFDVVINFHDGFILYGDDNEQFHFPPKFIAQTPARCWSRSPTNFVIRQGIMQDAITRRFGKPDNIRISFGNLKIKFVVEQFPEMDAVSLDVNHYLQTAEHAWHNPNHPEFRSYKGERRARLTADVGEALTKEVSRAQIKRESGPCISFLKVENTLVYKDDYGRIVRYENKPRTATWRKTHPSFWILVAYYRNEPQEGQKPNGVKEVSAELTYKTNGGPVVVPRARWFSPNKEIVDIGYNEVVGFVLAEYRRTGGIYARDRNNLVELAKKELTVSVRFLSGFDGSIIDGGLLKIESIKKGDEFDFRVSKIEAI